MDVVVFNDPLHMLCNVADQRVFRFHAGGNRIRGRNSPKLFQTFFSSVLYVKDEILTTLDYPKITY
jgi:hypothetical protein